MKKVIVENGRKRVLTVNSEASKCDPSFKDDCDAQLIVERFKRTGQLPRPMGPTRSGYYGDVSEVKSLFETFQIVEKAQLEFQALPAKIRSRFGNSMRSYVEFISDPANIDEMISLGLAERKEVVQDSEDSADKRQVSGTTGKSSAKPKAQGGSNGKSKGDVNDSEGDS